MQISMYDSSIPVMVRMLGHLKTVLMKGLGHAQELKYSEAVLLNARLAPDMFPLSRRVQVATDMAKGAAARLSGFEPPSYDDNETSFVQLLERIDRTTSYISEFTREQIDGSEGRSVVSKTRHGTFFFATGKEYLLNYVLPNFYFQNSTAYLILRHNGVSIGLDDFLGPQTTYNPGIHNPT